MDTTLLHDLRPDDSGIRPDLIEGIIIDRQIGSGATAAVYLGIDSENPRRRYAVKFLSQYLGEQEAARQRWEREARLLTNLKHTNIVEAYKFGVAMNRPYLVMEFLQGESLMDRLKRLGLLPEDEVLHIARSTLAALEAAHKQHIIHRDIKPANMLRLNDGTIKLMDFGLAREIDDLGVTGTGIIVGTPIYLSPEQAAGDPSLDIRSDLYALGVTLYHLACGQPPFPALNTSLLLTRKITDDVPDVRLIEPSISGATAHLLRMLCEREREKRIPNPADALHLMDQLQAGELTTTGVIPVERSSRAPLRTASIDQIEAGGTILQTIVGDQELRTKPCFLEEGEVLFYEDDDSRECYLMMSGRVEVLKSGRVIAEIKDAGSFIGEMSPLNNTPRTATVVARKETVLLRIEEEDFNNFFSRHPDMTIQLARSLASRLSDTNDRLNDANSRLAIISRHLQEMGSALRSG